MKPSPMLLVLVVSLAAAILAANLWIRRVDTAPPPHSRFVFDPAFGPKPRRAVVHPGETRASQAKKPEDRPKKKDSAVQGPVVSHEPQQPRSGQPILITADFKHHPAPSGELLLQYQPVDPGKYIALGDAAFEKQWATVPMNDRGDNGDRTGGDGIFTSQLPPNVQLHRRLVRYRIRSAQDNKQVAPDETDLQPNFAYFVYDGVPAWKGAIHPDARDAKLRQPVVYPSEVLQRVPVYHFLSSKSAVEKVTWREPNHLGDGDRHEYRYTGTMVYDGVVYDHIGFRARGGGWRHAMGKNMWKFNFLPGHRFEARDHYGTRYGAKWDKLNLGACIQQGDYGMRGEQGMFEAVGFRLFNLAGLESPRTHWVHLRIIDEREEASADQYKGDFWGLYLAVENIDKHFLKEHKLPAGNLYKMEFGAKTAFNGDPTIPDQSDVSQFVRASSRRQQPDTWWQENLDLARYYNYRAILECIHHYDIDAGKNYFYYRNPETRKWLVFPWDIDLSWGDHMYGGGQEPFYRAGVLSRAPFKQQFQERLAEIRDLLFNPEQIGLLIDEHAAMISDPRGGPSLVGADRAKWDYHPILESSYAMSMKAGQGKFYFGNAHNTFAAMVKYMKSYAAKRAKWVDSRLLAGYQPPAAPKVAPENLDFSRSNLVFRINSHTQGRNVRWRLAEVTQTNSPTFDPRQPWKYEIDAIWEQETTDPSVTPPVSLLAAGHTYRVRARSQAANGTWSRWSAPVQFDVPPRQGAADPLTDREQ